jgi:hypothetical protein
MLRDLHIIIFSKDRACQLESLLRSVRDHFHSAYLPITILYKATSPAFNNGYELAKKASVCDNVAWRPEQSFQNDVAAICGVPAPESLVMFLVDDDVMFRQCSIDSVLDAFSDEHLFISLRASRTYPADEQPEFITTGPYLEWQWNYSKKKWITWNYPFSVDGNIFHAAHISKIIRKISFEAPNSFEGRMHTYRHHWWVKWIKKALAPLDAAVFNNPLNRVQAESETWHNNLSPESLNKAFLSGMRINNAALYSARPDATHFDAGISFSKESG